MFFFLDSSRWHAWWSYDSGISGPNYWGMLNQNWTLCKRGRNQSPVNIEPKALLFDPSLTPLEISGSAITGVLVNKGHSLTLDVELASHWSRGVNISGGPLSYTYRVSQLRVHFSHSDTDGSEHTVEGKGFSAEVSNTTNPHFERIHRALDDVLYKGEQREISYLELRGLFPPTDHYMTYEGSLTHPACHETVTWIIYNKPVYISSVQIAGLRRLKQDTKSNPVLLMAGNIRPVQPLNQRTIRTNINLGEGACSMERDINYAVNHNYFQYQRESYHFP
ncbi:carbonic anhydrase-related protein [Elysia marginata]|uniref:Carbonic anhydrase-related protein n=1 Tax=Elysia marginata TaxID=1093978 RepID=A0AAV4H563_9GAST|nr:carbonic anhydrase-related protein [Elysia marginata]